MTTDDQHRAEGDSQRPPLGSSSEARWFTWRSEEVPSWLASVIFHGLLLAALALYTYPVESSPEPLILSTRIAEEELAEQWFDAPLDRETLEQTQESEEPSATDLSSSAAELGVELEDEARQALELSPGPLELSLVVDDAALALPVPVGEKLSGSIEGLADHLAGRGEGIKGKLLAAYGGTTTSERAVTLGLEWLERHQNEDGSWSLHAYNSVCEGQCDGTGVNSDTAGTAFGLLPFLGAGHTHQRGRYQEVVQKGLDWLLAHQSESGDLQSGGGRMYSHALAAIALCEAYGMSRDSQLREPAQKAIDFIVKAQDPRGGGWRYDPGQPGDTSVFGWQLMALVSGHMAKLEIPPNVVVGAVNYLNTAAADPLGSTYGYMPGTDRTYVMTAEALLARMYLGWPREHPSLAAGVNWLLKEHLPNMQDRNFYYWYYATQMMHHIEGPVWQLWNSRIRELLVATQVQKGHPAGSWDPARPAPAAWGKPGGRLYVTSLAILTLEVYYRHLPLYSREPIEGF